MKKIWIWIVGLCGWHWVMPDESTRQAARHAVVAVAPHTCIADFFVGPTLLWKLGLNVRIFMKKEFFNWFTTPFLKKAGVIAVDRGNRKNNLVGKAVEMFNTHEEFTQVITVEGTRKPVKKFKRGYYEIATQAQVPIILGYMDYKKKSMGMGPVIEPGKSYEEVEQILIDFFKDVTPKHTEGWYYWTGHQQK